ncbi:MAG: hypothetical protein WKF75_15450, partial [Singulisphaera sp.]
KPKSSRSRGTNGETLKWSSDHAQAARNRPSRCGAGLQKVGYRVLRQGKPIVVTDGVRKVPIPRHNPVNAITMAGIVRDAGLTIDKFRTRL